MLVESSRYVDCCALRCTRAPNDDFTMEHTIKFSDHVRELARDYAIEAIADVYGNNITYGSMGIYESTGSVDAMDLLHRDFRSAYMSYVVSNNDTVVSPAGIPSFCSDDDLKVDLKIAIIMRSIKRNDLNDAFSVLENTLYEFSPLDLVVLVDTKARKRSNVARLTPYLFRVNAYVLASIERESSIIPAWRKPPTARMDDESPIITEFCAWRIERTKSVNSTTAAEIAVDVTELVAYYKTGRWDMPYNQEADQDQDLDQDQNFDSTDTGIEHATNQFGTMGISDSHDQYELDAPTRERIANRLNDIKRIHHSTERPQSEMLLALDRLKQDIDAGIA